MPASPAPAHEPMMHALRAQLAAVTGGLAPDDYAQAFWDWYLHLSTGTDKRASLLQSASRAMLDSWNFALQAASGQTLPPVEGDKRFAAPGWNQWPFNVFARNYLNWSSLMNEAVNGVPGVSARSEQLMQFIGKQNLDALNPANHLATNPELLEMTRAESGQNLVRGVKHWLEDMERVLKKQPPAGTDKFTVGGNLAVTPGRVVLRNELMELIQYEPQTPEVYAEPVLIAPAWIMKYYILDLSPANSLVRYLVEKGHTVFMISWKNPNATDRDLGMDDYVHRGFLAALNAVTSIVPRARVHAVGYCIGGTLLSIAAAALARSQDARLASITLLAAQTDFSEPGELSLFISPSQLEMLESVMRKAGVLDSDRMAGAFALLRSNDLLWAPAINTYIKGRREGMNDLMAWNADGTRMPCRMHADYLRQLYLQNDLARGEFTLAGERVDLGRIDLPMFVVGTETDHVAPWKSVFKVRQLTRSADYTFLLTSGGHNAGIVSGPVHPKRRFRHLSFTDAQAQPSPEQWLERATVHTGSWWPWWQQWLTDHSGSQRGALPSMGNAPAGYGIVGDAPGQYVLQR